MELTYVTLQGLFDEVAADSDVNQLRRFVLLYLLSIMSLQHHGDYIFKSLELDQCENFQRWVVATQGVSGKRRGMEGTGYRVGKLSNTFF